MANRKYIVGGKVYEETGERKVIVGGKVLEETTAAAAGGLTVPQFMTTLRKQNNPLITR
jgi:hypothetical protein